DLQARITEDLDALLAAFPRGDATASVVLMLLQTVSVQRAIPARASAPAVDPEALRMRVFELLTRLHVSSWSAPRSLLLQIPATFLGVFTLFAVLLLTCAAVVPLVVSVPESVRRLVLGLAVCGAMAAARGTRPLCARLWRRIRQNLAERRYHQMARLSVL